MKSTIKNSLIQCTPDILKIKLGLLALVLGLTLFVSSCGPSYVSGWHILDPTLQKGFYNLTYLLAGVLVTLELSVWAVLWGIVLGLMIALMRLSRFKWLRFTAITYTELLRSLPLFVLLLWVYYALPIIILSLPEGYSQNWFLGIIKDMSPLSAAVTALALNSGAFFSEIFRAGIETIPKGQTEAARSLGFSKFHTMKNIVLPQALRKMLPPTVSQFIHTVKDSALASAIGLMELTRRATELQTHTFRPLEVYTFLALEYILLLLILTTFSRMLEKRWRV